jgi:fatty acid desaturase
MTPDRYSYLHNRLREFGAFRRNHGADLLATLFVALTFVAMRLAPWQLAVVMSPMLAAAMFVAFGLFHDAVHRPTMGFMPTIMGHACGLTENWRNLHLDHHRFTGDEDLDPTAEGLRRLRAGGIPGILVKAWRYWIPLGSILQHIVFWRNDKVGAAFTAVIWFGYFTGGHPLKFMPGVYLYFLLTEYVNTAHHTGFGYRTEVLKAREQPNVTRSCRYPAWLATIAANFNLHAEHHLFPRVTWTHLPMVSALLLPEEIPHRLTAAEALAYRRQHLGDVLFPRLPK